MKKNNLVFIKIKMFIFSGHFAHRVTVFPIRISLASFLSPDIKKKNILENRMDFCLMMAIENNRPASDPNLLPLLWSRNRPRL